MEYKINSSRLEKNLFEMSKIGKNRNGGIDRAFGSEADKETRKWLMQYWKEHLNAEIEIDAVANMWVKSKGEEDLPPIVFGSHHDAVPNGGMYDGALGVLLATEILETLKEHQTRTRHPFVLVSFTGEEPNPFNVSTLGSKVLSGRLNKKDLEKLSSYIDGSSLECAIAATGGNMQEADDILVRKGDISAFIECHIEQGRRLIDKGLATAAVDCITGIYRENITVKGEANHGGTTIMQNRHDALLAACEFNLMFEEILKEENNEEVVGTIGYLLVSPNAVSIIPGEVEMVLEIRTSDSTIKKEILSKVEKAAELIQRERGIVIDRKLNLDQQEMPMDKDVVNAILTSISDQDEKPVLTSMAGHDAANMQRVTKSGMIFVQSAEGKSHCPQEYTDIKAIEKTGNAMLKALLKLDKELD